MRIINLVDSVENVNYGIWHAAVVNAGLLAEQGIQSEIWYPEQEFDQPDHVIAVPLSSLSISSFKSVITTRKLNPANDIIITHGSWRYPTRWGAMLKKRGFTWMYVPQGMLEPWSLQQKWLKKQLYFHVLEKRLISQADALRAVSLPEHEHLKDLIKSAMIRFIPNGVHVDTTKPDLLSGRKRVCYLFLSRLHHKKNITALATAWLQSSLNNDSAYELLIAGPDQGELEKLQPLLTRSSNIRYIGSVYGEKKKELFNQCTFYVLPSFSEGLPSSLLEAMSHGLVPIITDGCNLPDVFTSDLGVRIKTDADDIVRALQQTSNWDIDQVIETGLKARNFIKEHYSLEAVTEMQIDLFTSLKAHAANPVS